MQTARTAASRTARHVQLELSGDVLARYAREWIVDIQDMSEFVRERRVNALSPPYTELITPREDVYTVAEPGLAWRLGLSSAAT